MGMKKKIGRIAGLSLCLTLLFSTNAFAEWRQEQGNWWFVNADGSYAKDGWQWIGNKCYYFTSEGYCLMNTKTPDGNDVDASGAWIVDGVVQIRPYNPVKGWNDVDGTWKYYTGSKYITSDWKTIENKRYYFDENGNMAKGFRHINGDQYYFNDDGSLQMESFTLDDMRYIIKEKGIIADEIDEFDWFTGNYRDSDDDDYDRSDDYDNSWYYDNSDYDDDYDYSDYYNNDTIEADEGSYAYEVFEIVNRERRKEDRENLEWDVELAYCAQERAYEIHEKYEHTRPDGSSWYTILKDEGISYQSCGENIAYGQRSPENVMNAWMNSTGHKNNILKSSFGRMGVGCAYVNGSYYWVQIFAD
ncbi:hypothetical protein C0033_04265 [Clostridium sp. chh4-2]|nr:hypothetical protein C0033_04265 [Clostridium sp. chh4-2]